MSPSLTICRVCGLPLIDQVTTSVRPPCRSAATTPVVGSSQQDQMPSFRAPPLWMVGQPRLCKGVAVLHPKARQFRRR